MYVAQDGRLKMTYRDLIKKVSSETSVSYNEAEAIVSQAIDVIIAKAKEGISVRLKRLGTIKPHERGARKRYIPGTGAIRKFTPVKSIKLIPSTEIKKLLNKKSKKVL